MTIRGGDMSFGQPRRFPRPERRAPWGLIIVMAIVLTVCCFVGLLFATVQRIGGDDDPSSPASAAAAPSGSAARGPVSVPTLVGKRLPDAEQRLTSVGLDAHVVDATGRNRVVLSRENWIVRSQDPAAGRKVAAGSKITLRVSKPTDVASTQAPVDGVIPDVVCRDLQAAQDAMQAAGFFVLDSVDGTGKGRRQLVDRNWVVTGQSVAAGTRPVRSTRVLLTVVKISESTDRCGTS
ncbi:Stk1 family PASTA domain-containing Ser/Thr kinase [Cryptosporangium phraense]|uniref:PASTA domain-containing protein n=1 Tax=Cryptosporangium phraense TaxID=2593070 RepID=A0A545B0B9_9ACTN|nr:Stk1 family PASTA domain-containing Ser/Thr kinase [Cryptosporangium phraense]TQS47033.1 PASTA domain-containing protein [Cryptosporangium phraense]